MPDCPHPNHQAIRKARIPRLQAARPFLALIAALAVVPLAAAELAELEQEALRAAVARVAPSVVQIETVGGMERQGRLLFGTGPTTGLVMSAEGHIVSSAFNFLHKPASILVHLPDGRRKAARLVATDHSRMVVLLKIEIDSPLGVPEVAPQAEMRVGQWAVAVGRTFDVRQPNAAVGILSATNRIWGKAIQTDAAVSPNNYGGPLVDIRGRVLGLLVPMSPEESSEVAGLEWYDSGIGFAVPAEAIQQALPRLKQGKDLQAGVAGIHFARSLYTGEPRIVASRPNSPARQAGLKAGDLIVEIDGRPITLAAQVKEAISRRYAGDRLRVVVLRKDQRSRHDIELVAALDPYEHPFLGLLPMRGVAPNGEEKPAPASHGVRVRYVYADGPAAKAGLQRGDRITALAGKPVEGPQALRALLADYSPGEPVELTVQRAEKPLKLQLTLARLPEGIPEELPPAWTEASASKATRPKLGQVPLQVPGMDHKAWAYVPENYDPAVRHGLVLWLHGPGGLDEKALLEQWKPLCQRDRLILLVPTAADPSRWEMREAALLVRLMGEAQNRYRVDPARIVVVGRETGGNLACALGFAAPLVQGVCAVDAAMAITPPDNEPARRLAFFLARSQNPRFAAEVDEAAQTLRGKKYPVTLENLNGEPRALNAAELARLLRWIDALDRL